MNPDFRKNRSYLETSARSVRKMTVTKKILKSVFSEIWNMRICFSATLSKNRAWVGVFDPLRAGFVYITVRFWTLGLGGHETRWGQYELKKCHHLSFWAIYLDFNVYKVTFVPGFFESSEYRGLSRRYKK